MVQLNRQDLLVLESNDLMIVDGDFVVENSNNQHIRHIFQGNTGDFVEKPLLGIGFQSKINMPLTPELRAQLRRKIAIQLQIDDYNASEINIAI